MPQMYLFTVKSKRSEATLGLSTIFKAQIAYFAGNSYYTPNLKALGIEMGAPPNEDNGQCIEGQAVVCGKHYSFHIPFGNIPLALKRLPMAGLITSMVVKIFLFYFIRRRLKGIEHEEIHLALFGRALHDIFNPRHCWGNFSRFATCLGTWWG